MAPIPFLFRALSLQPPPTSFVGLIECDQRFDFRPATVDECIETCGAGFLPYGKWDVLVAVSTFIFPLLVLVGNVHLSAFQVGTTKRLCGLPRTRRIRFLNLCISYTCQLSRLMGNPVGYLAAHISKLDHMRRIRKDAIANNVNIHVALVDMLLDDFDQSGVAQRYARQLRGHDRAEFGARCRVAAGDLPDVRVSSVRRSAVAVVSYSILLFLALAGNVAQDSEAIHTPHTIALRMLYYWLFNAVALSSALGAFPTPRTARKHLQRVLDGMTGPRIRLKPLGLWTGGSYGFRPQGPARMYDPKSTRRFPLQRLRDLATSPSVISMLIVVGAWVFAFLTSLITPALGLGCRGLMEIGYMLVWILNFFVTQAAMRWAGEWWPAIATFFDILFAIPMVILLFAAFRGWFNSCRCWGADWTLRVTNFIPYDIRKELMQLTPTYYGLIWSAVAFQALVSACVLCYYRHELRLIYEGSTADASDEETHLHNDAVSLRPRIPGAEEAGTFNFYWGEDKHEPLTSASEILCVPKPASVATSRYS